MAEMQTQTPPATLAVRVDAAAPSGELVTALARLLRRMRDARTGKEMIAEGVRAKAVVNAAGASPAQKCNAANPTA